MLSHRSQLNLNSIPVSNTLWNLPDSRILNRKDDCWQFEEVRLNLEQPIDKKNVRRNSHSTSLLKLIKPGPSHSAWLSGIRCWWTQIFHEFIFLLQGISFAGPALCLAGCAILTPAGANHTAGILSKQAVGLMVGLLSMSFALSAWARGGLYCNHQVGLLVMQRIQFDG